MPSLAADQHRTPTTTVTPKTTHPGRDPAETIAEGSLFVSTTTEQNKTVIRRFFDAWNDRQPDAFDGLVASNVVRHCEATPGMEARSLDQVKEFLRLDTAVFPDLSKRSNCWLPRGISSLLGPLMRARSRDKWGISTLWSQGAIRFRGDVPHRRRKDRRMVGDLGQHDDAPSTRPPSEWLTSVDSPLNSLCALLHEPLKQLG
jgi:hypothetical protein